MNNYTITLTFYTQGRKNMQKLSVTDKTYTMIVEQRKKEIANMYGVSEAEIEVTREGLF